MPWHRILIEKFVSTQFFKKPPTFVELGGIASWCSGKPVIGLCKCTVWWQLKTFHTYTIPLRYVSVLPPIVCTRSTQIFQKSTLHHLKIVCTRRVTRGSFQAEDIQILGRLRLKCDGTAQKPDFFFRRNGRVHLNRQGHQFSRLVAAEVCTSAAVMLDTPCSEVVRRVLATHSIRQFPLHFPSRASPCAITFQLESAMLKNLVTQDSCTTSLCRLQSSLST